MNRRMNGIVVALSFSAFGCASSLRMNKLDQSRSIDIADSGPRYMQGGQPLDGRDMLEKLQKEPEAASDANGAETLATIAMILSAGGGGLIGWPVGEAAAGNKDPTWALAGAGAGAIALAIPLLFWSGSSLKSAVQAHNQAVSRRFEATVPASASKPEEAFPRGRMASAPPGPFGFVFGASKEESAAVCRLAGFVWSDAEGATRCSGVPFKEVPGAEAQLAFEHDALSFVELVVRPPDDAQGWAGAFRETEAALVRRYGKAEQRDFVVPDECKAAERFVGCVADEQVTGNASWSFPDGRTVVMSIAAAPSPPTLRVRLTAGRPKT